MRTIHLVPFLFVTALATAVHAEDGSADAACSVHHELGAEKLLRRLSLDLRGTIPDVAEYDEITDLTSEAELDVVLDQIVTAYFEDDGFRQTTRRYHEAFLWPNIGNVRFAGTRYRLVYANDGPALRISSGGRSNLFRGDPDITCSDFKHTNFDPDFPGQFRPLPQNGKEGWREIHPYWDPSTTLKVCASEAQETKNVAGVSCNSLEGLDKKACGCGPNLAYCYGPANVTDKAVQTALREQLLRQVDDAVASDADYTDIVLGTSAWQDGRIATFKRVLGNGVDFNKTIQLADANEGVLEKDFMDTTFELVERGPKHAGVLTLPGYTLKFQTARGRANRFRQAFQCKAFEPPSETEEESDACSTTAGDLTKRCTCRYCHSTLEPLAAGFSLFTEAGTTLMDKQRFPRFDGTCPASDPFCTRFYVTSGPHKGSLLPLEFADNHPEYEEIFEAGPRQVAQAAIWIDGDPEKGARTDAESFAGCAARRAFTFFVRRDPTLDEEDLVEELATTFAASGFRFRDLVRDVVMLEAYRRVR
ncbi:MAG: DUF1585 domain-containing protein [Polyangiaceae bacterium]|nr:DUF1585 domain-containing protein [Polyangiaceae bacterium]